MYLIAIAQVQGGELTSLNAGVVLFHRNSCSINSSKMANRLLREKNSYQLSINTCSLGGMDLGQLPYITTLLGHANLVSHPLLN